MLWVTVYNKARTQENTTHVYFCIHASLKVSAVGSTSTGGPGKMVKAMQLEAFLRAIYLMIEYIRGQKQSCIYNRGWLLDHAS